MVIMHNYHLHHSQNQQYPLIGTSRIQCVSNSTKMIISMNEESLSRIEALEESLSRNEALEHMKEI